MAKKEDFVRLPIRLTAHAVVQCRVRGATEAEIRDAVIAGEWEEAKNGRFISRLNLQFGGLWGGQSYPIKQVHLCS